MTDPIAALAAAQVFDIIRVANIAAGSPKYRREYNSGHAASDWSTVMALARAESEADFSQIGYWLSYLNLQDSRKQGIIDMVRGILDNGPVDIEITEI